MERYETISKLATSSSAVVYLARDKEDGALVAVKVYQQAHIMPQVLKSATREATLLRRCEGHPNVVKLLLAFRSERGRVYLVEEYLPRSLESLMSSGMALPWDTVWDLTHQLFTAIQFLHKKKVIHRDLKPRNLMLSEAGVLKVIDFGLARLDRPEDGRLTQYVLSRWYRAPEVLVGAAYGCEVDIWAAGCIVAELATGRPLFPGTNQMDQLQQLLHCFGTLPPQLMEVCGALISNDILVLPRPERCVDLATRLRSVPHDLLRVIEACLQPDPLKRPAADAVLQLPGLAGFARPADRPSPPAEGPEATGAGSGGGSNRSSCSLRTSEGHSAELPARLELPGGVEPHAFGSQLPSEALLMFSGLVASESVRIRHTTSLPDSLASSPATSEQSFVTEGLLPRAPTDAAGPAARSLGGRLMSAFLGRRAPTASKTFNSGSRQPSARPVPELSSSTAAASPSSDRSGDAASMARMRTLDMLESKLFGTSPPLPPPPLPMAAAAATSKAPAAAAPAPAPQAGARPYVRRSVEIPPAAAMYDHRERDRADRTPSANGSSSSQVPEQARREQVPEQPRTCSAAPRRSVNRFGWADSQPKLSPKSPFSRTSAERPEPKAPGPAPPPASSGPAAARVEENSGRRASTFTRASVERVDPRSPAQPPAPAPSSTTPASPAALAGSAAAAFRTEDSRRASVAPMSSAASAAPVRPSTGRSTSSTLPRLDVESLPGWAPPAHKPSSHDTPSAASPPSSRLGPGASPDAGRHDGSLLSGALSPARSLLDGHQSPKVAEDKLSGRFGAALRLTSVGSEDALASKVPESLDRCLRERTVSFGASRTASIQSAGSGGDFSWIKIAGESEDGGGGSPMGEGEQGQQVTAWRGRSLPRRGLSAFALAAGADPSSPRRQPGAEPGPSPMGSSAGSIARRPSLKDPSMRRSFSRDRPGSDAAQSPGQQWPTFFMG